MPCKQHLEVGHMVLKEILPTDDWLLLVFTYVWIYYSTIDKKLNTHKKLLVSRIGREKDANNDESLAVHDKKNLYL